MRIRADRELRLGARFAVEGPGALGCAIRAGAIPLREPTSCGRAENLDVHDWSLAAGNASPIFWQSVLDIFPYRNIYSCSWHEPPPLPTLSTQWPNRADARFWTISLPESGRWAIWL